MRRRNYYRVKKVYPKQKWLPVNNEIRVNGYTVNPTSYVLRYEIITQNETRTNNSGGGNVSAASIIKTGRFNYRGIIYSTSSSVSYIVGISYIPEGYILNSNTSTSQSQLGECFFYKHPEWVFAWTRLDYNTTSQSNEIRLSSRLKRNLNSGDQVIFFVIAINNSTGSSSVSTSDVQGTVSYVCRTN